MQGLDWVPVLIDFGLTKRIGDSMRLALAKMVVSAELLDYGGLLDSHQVRPGACVCRCIFVNYVGGDWRCLLLPLLLLLLRLSWRFVCVSLLFRVFSPTINRAHGVPVFRNYQDMGLVVSSESAGEDMGNVLYNFRKVRVAKHRVWSDDHTYGSVCVSFPSCVSGKDWQESQGGDEGVCSNELPVSPSTLHQASYVASGPT